MCFQDASCLNNRNLGVAILWFGLPSKVRSILWFLRFTNIQSFVGWLIWSRRCHSVDVQSGPGMASRAQTPSAYSDFCALWNSPSGLLSRFEGEVIRKRVWASLSRSHKGCSDDYSPLWLDHELQSTP
jgi:hypothetical protein